MADVNINKFRASVVRDGSKPASPGFIVSEGQDPVDPAGNGQNHLPVTIATAATGLSITDSQVLGGAGNVGQYIRGDGSLADFPQASGGGSSVSYYLNGSISQGTIGGVAYKELNKVPILGAGTDFTINADGYIASFITDAGDPNKLLIPAGNWNLETYFSASSSGGTPSFYVELYKYNGTTFTLIATSSSAPELIAFGTNLNPYFSTLAVPETVLALTDRLALRYYVTHSGRTITLHTENNHLCQVITTFTTGLTALNGLTSQVQYLTVGTSGTDFAISSVTDTHTFNLPTASATNRGALSSADWTTFNNKTSNLGTVTSVGLSSATSGVTIGSTPVTTSGTITLAIATASGSQNGLLSSTDWTTFNGKQNALTNPVTGTGTTNYLPKFTGSTTIGNSQVFDNGTNVGINTNSPLSTNLLGALTIVKSYSSDTPASTTAQTYYTNQSGLYLFGRNSGLTIVGANNEENQIIFANTSTVAFASINTATGSSSTGGDMYFKVGSNTERMRIFSDGNVFIGTSPSNAGFKLDVNGTGRFSGRVTIGNDVGYALTYGRYSAGIPISYLRAGTDSTGGFRLTNHNGADVIVVNGSNAITLDGALSVTGAATFSSTLTFSGLLTSLKTSGEVFAATSATTGSLYQRFQNSGSQFFFGIDNSTGSDFGGGNYSANIYSGSNVNLNFATNNAIRLTITGGGNVGIGTASPDIFGFGSAGKYLTLQANSGGFSLIQVISDGTSGSGINFGNATIRRASIDALNGSHLEFYTNGSNSGTSVSPRMRITSGGNVLIGTTTDSGARLQVAASVLLSTFTSTTSTQFTGLEMKNGGGSFYFGQDNSSGTFYGSGAAYAGSLYLSGGYPMAFFTSGTERMRITSGGNVLIGTTTNGASRLRIVGLPTSSAGLSSGDVWSDSGTLKIA